MKLSEIIMNYRNEHGLSQRQFGAQCGLSSGYISLIEKEINPQTGKRTTPTLPVLNKIAKGLGMTIDDLLSVCDDMPVSLSYKTAIMQEDSPIDDLAMELISLFAELSQEKKGEALNYLRYLADR